MTAEERKKRVAVFDPVARSCKLIAELLQRLGYQVDPYPTAEKLLPVLKGPNPVDLLIINLLVFGESYQEITEQLKTIGLSGMKAPPILALASLHLSLDARERLLQLGISEVQSLEAPWMELLFSTNRLLFPKIRELRRYTRVFGGFPIQFSQGKDWRQGEVYNLSQEGAFIQCEQPPSENTRLKVRFTLPGVDAPIEVKALVTWANDSSGGPVSPAGIGVNFLTMNEEESESLSRFIAGRVNGSDRPL